MGDTPMIPQKTLNLQRRLVEVLRPSIRIAPGALSDRVASVISDDNATDATTPSWPAGINDELWLGPPPGVVRAITAVLSGAHHEHVLELFAGGGVLLSAVRECKIAGGGVAVGPNPHAAVVASAMGAKFGFQVITENPINWLEANDSTFDLVLACPPWGMGTKAAFIAINDRKVEVRDEIGHLVIAHAGRLLKEGGVGVFAVNPASFLRRAPYRLASQMAALGLTVEALLYLPKDSFAPWSSIRGALAVIRREDDKDLFVGEWIDVAERDVVLIENWRRRRRGADPGLGRIVKWSTFTSLDSLRAEEMVDRLGRSLGFERTPMGEIVSESRLTKGTGATAFEDLPNAVYIPTIGSSAAVSSTSELRLKAHNYAQLLVRTELVSRAYLTGYLNSPLGVLARKQQLSGGTIPHLNREGIQRITVFLPELIHQNAIVETDRRIEELESDLSERRRRLWSDPKTLLQTRQYVSRVGREESFSEWLEGLPYPLASILWAYHTAGSDHRKGYEYLLHYFEALSEFLAVVLLSAARTSPAFGPEVLGQELPAALEKGRLSLREASFGTWNCIHAFLSKRFRDLIRGTAEQKTLASMALRSTDEELQAMLTSTEIVGVLQEAGKLRNLWHGHGGAVSDREAYDRNQKLIELLGRVRRAFGTSWDRFEAVIPGTGRFNAGQFSYTVRRAMGRAFPFAEHAATLSEPMEDGYLHFLGAGETRALRVLPFVRFGKSPEAAQSACYFYNRRQKDQIRYVSYHFEDEAELVAADAETERLVVELSGSRGPSDLPRE